MRALLLGILAAGLATPQTAPEVSSQESSANFRARVNLVLVPVVVRDAKGHAIDGLKREDFQLFDQGKPQSVSRFSVEQRGQPHVQRTEEEKAPEPAVPAGMPERFTLYFFDDVRLEAGDLVRAREAASRHLAANLGPADRAAVFTSSGQNMVDFTDDRDKLQQGLMRLMPRPSTVSGMAECPEMDYYMADLIVNHNDSGAIDALKDETRYCLNLDERLGSERVANQIQQQIQLTARVVRENGREQTRLALRGVADAVRRIAAMPGQRTIVVVSPGFLNLESRLDQSEIADRAIRANITINTLNARGLFVTGLPDIAKRDPGTQSAQLKRPYENLGATLMDEVLAELAENTGGTYYHNSNDLRDGFQKLAAAPEVTYILGFSPQNLKVDGKYHKLKVTIRQPPGLTLFTRRGYFAPLKIDDPAAQSHREIEEALFSREELRELSADLNTRFFKTGDGKARLTVLARVDLRQLQFRKQEDRNCDELTVVYGLFDRNGNYLDANQAVVTLRLLDNTLQKKLQAPITLRSSFLVPPGTYLIRMVVRDSEGQLMAARNGGVEIP